MRNRRDAEGDGSEATDETLAASSTDATVAASSTDATLASDGADATLASSSGVAPSIPVRVIAGRPDYQSLVAIERAHYTIGSELARGGMGRIFTARDRRLGRTVAIKELLADSPTSRARFEREARITANLQHPAIVNVLEAGTWPSGEPFYVMKLVVGRPLDRVLVEATTVAQRLELLPKLISVVEALAYAHSRRVIHRDLKPGNILVGDFGEMVVIDWGLAKDLEASTKDGDLPAGPFRGRADETMDGAVMGTPAFMSVEQASGEPVDERTDVYALGALLYNVLAGAPPYSGSSAEDVLAKVLRGPPTPLGERVPDLPPDLVTIVQKAMARGAEDRYATAQQLAEDLRRFQTGQLVGAHRYSTRELVARWVRRHRAALSVAAVLVTILIAGGVFAVHRILEQRDIATTEQQRAELARADAEQRKTESDTQRLAAQHLVDYVLVELKKKLQPIGKLDALEGIGAAVATYYDQAGPGHGGMVLADRRNHADALNLIARTQMTKGDLEASERTYGQAREILRELLAAPGDEDQTRRVLVTTLDGLAVLAQKLHRGPALAALLTEREQLAREALAKTPNDAYWNAALGGVLMALSNSMIESDLAKGRAYSDEAWVALDRAAKLDPGNRAYATDRAAAAQYQGLIHANLAHWPEAIEAFARAVTLQKILVEERADDTDAISRLQRFSHFLGLARTRAGQLAAGRATTLESLALSKRLVDIEPNNVKWAMGLADGYSALAASDLEQRQYQLALRDSDVGLAALAPLIARTKDQEPRYTRMVLAEVQLKARIYLRDRAAILEAYRRMADAVTGWQDGSPPQETIALAKANFTAGELLRATDQHALAATFLERSIQIAEPVVRDRPSEVDPASTLALAYEELGRVRLAVRDAAGAEAAFRKEVELGEVMYQRTKSALLAKRAAKAYAYLAEAARSPARVELANKGLALLAALAAKDLRPEDETLRTRLAELAR